MSGGQRKRIHLARALYQDKDIYMLDCPLDSLDRKVAQKVATGILNNYQEKTRIIFSNSTEFWNGVDRVYFIENGQL